MFRLFALIALLSLWPPQHALGADTSTPVICGDASQTTDLFVDQADEKICLAKLKGIAARSGCAMTLTLENGSTKTYTDRSSDCGLPENQSDQTELFELLAWLPASHTFVIEEYGAEWAGTVLVSSRTGHEQQAWTGLHFSPDGRYIAEINAVDGDASADYAIAIWSFDGDPVKLLLKREQGAEGEYEVWAFKGWVGSNKILASVEKHDPADRSRWATYPAEITLSQDGHWILAVSTKSE